MIVFCVGVGLWARHLTQNREQRIEELLACMTLEEKAGQLNLISGTNSLRENELKQGLIGSFLNITGAEQTNRLQRIAVEETRLGIPLLFGMDVIHGYRTIFPIPLAQACAWDTGMVRAIETVAAREARAAGVHWTYAPMVDIARDPRWGRIAEGSGEDPYLASFIASARVQGFQGEDPLGDDEALIACLKHFAAYGAAEAGRDYRKVDISEKTLREIYLPPFAAGIKSGALSLMTAFQTLNGIPATAHPFILGEILRKEWDYKGLIVSDYPSVRELITHGYARDERDAGSKAMTAGVDMDMMGEIYGSILPELVRNGQISTERLDDAVRKVLKLKWMAGLFDDPFIPSELESEILMRSDHIEMAREAAQKSMVLLKNDESLLPLPKNIGSVAVIGPLAKSRPDYLGTWACRGRAEDVITIWDGIRAKLKAGSTVRYALGCLVDSEGTEDFEAAVRLARESEAVIAVVGESAAMSGEAASRASLDLPGNQLDLLKALKAVEVPIVVVLMNGRPLSIPWVDRHIPAVLEAWHPGIQGGHAVAEILFGDVNPSGKLVASFPRSVGQVPIYYSHENTGRPAREDEKYTSKYLDVPVTPLYPFGYGLSYNAYVYHDLNLSAEEISPQETLQVGVTVHNRGERSGEEVAQLYIHDRVASTLQPVRKLRGFKKIFLKPGESRTLTFTLGPEELSIYNQEMRRVVEPGLFDVWVGGSSRAELHADFKVTGES